MKHFGRAPVTLATLILTCVLLPYSGWFAERDAVRPIPNQETRLHGKTRELSAQAVGRYRAAQATHWRALLVHH